MSSSELREYASPRPSCFSVDDLNAAYTAEPRRPDDPVRIGELDLVQASENALRLKLASNDNFHDVMMLQGSHRIGVDGDDKRQEGESQVARLRV